VASSVVVEAKGRIMNNLLNDKQLEELLDAARAAGRAEGYAQAQFEFARERARIAVGPPSEAKLSTNPSVAVTKVEKLEVLKAEAEKVNAEAVYTTRTTVTMTKAIALDYLRSVAPRIVGPSEIKKNSEKDLGVFISFGTLKRAIVQLVAAGDVEMLEESRWRYKARGADAGTALRSVR
jgi:hypothetical protein